MKSADLNILLASLAVFVLVFLIIPFAFPGTPLIVLFINAMSVFVAWLAFIAHFRLWLFFSKNSPELAKAWRFIVVGFALWLLGEAVYAFFQIILNVELPYPSLADIPWLLGYAGFIAGMWLARPQKSYIETPVAERVFVWGIGLIFAMFVIVMVLPDIMASGAGPLEQMISFAYPVGDVLLAVSALALFLRFSRHSTGLVWCLIAFGFMVFSGADLWFSSLTAQGSYYVGHPLDYIYAAAYVVQFLGPVWFVHTYGRDWGWDETKALLRNSEKRTGGRQGRA